jgi:HEPN domain-containing protein
MEAGSKMTNEEKFAYWLELAQYDMNTAQAMYDTGRWFYVVFMCQQAIEKLVKGLYHFYLDKVPPRTHAIGKIAEEFEDKVPVLFSEEQKLFFNKLSTFYLNNRYPDFVEHFAVQLTEEIAKTTLDQTKEVFQWLLTLKP